MTGSFRIGPMRLAPHKRDGGLTGKWLVDIPAPIAGGSRRRKFFDNRIDATRFARELERRYRRGELKPVRAQSQRPAALIETVERWREFQALRVATGKKRQSSLDGDNYRLRVLIQAFWVRSSRCNLRRAHRRVPGRTAETGADPEHRQQRCSNVDESVAVGASERPDGRSSRGREGSGRLSRHSRSDRRRSAANNLAFA